MTVIAWDGKCLASDSMGTTGNMPFTTRKIVKHGDALMGTAGISSMGRELINWYISGADKYGPWPDKSGSGETNLLVIVNPGKILLFSSGGYPIEVKQQFFAIGSGRDYAMAAMHYGKSAVEAVQLACVYDVACGGSIDVLDFSDEA